jgi:holo-[acyl-carrier protein] synthase
VIGLGIDLVDVDHFQAALLRTPRLGGRLFTEAERASSHGQVHRLAARFAAKEALMKALGVGLGAFAFHDAEVVNEPSGQPVFVLAGAAACLVAERGVTSLHLTMTHTRHTAAAVVLAL